MGKPLTREPRLESERQRARERVLEAAGALFYRDSVHAVGVDAIARKAGVAKISLYRNYDSKDDLVVAYLARRRADFWHQWDDAFARYAQDPRAQLDAIMGYLAERTAQPGYRGCPFLNFCCEFPEDSHPGRAIAEAVKREMSQRLLRIARALGVHEPKRLAEALLLLVEGAYATSQTSRGRNGAARSLVWAANALVDAQPRLHTSVPAP